MLCLHRLPREDLFGGKEQILRDLEAADGVLDRRGNSEPERERTELTDEERTKAEAIEQERDREEGLYEEQTAGPLNDYQEPGDPAKLANLRQQLADFEAALETEIEAAEI